MIANWSNLTKLTTPSGTLDLNAAAGDRYLTLNERCDSGADLRTTFDNIPEADGQLNHRQYLTGYKMRLALGLVVDQESACGQDAWQMLDALAVHIDELRNPTGDTRIVWHPDGLAERMIDQIVLMEKPVVTVEPTSSDSIVTVTFGVVSPFPYEMSEAEQTPASIAASATETLTNTGTTQFWPVFKVNGATSTFTITNAATGLQIVYDGTAIAGGHYAEIDCFRGTIYLDGDGANLLNGIDFLNTDFFALVPGANDITITGAGCDVLWNDAYL